jgi:A/G-specific adenine glycosylase
VIPVDSGHALRTAVLDWYRSNGRQLAFRRTTDPWAVLVSEFMAQQTQAARAAVAWERFLITFPTPAALAAAGPADVLRAWRGLGYNRRALSLRAAAIQIVERHGGSVPEDLDALDALPGIGPYTARAVAALAFGARAGAVDTNVRRVLTRALFDGPPTVRGLQAAADELVPADRPGEWTHALMDVGAAFCRPREPRCDACPLQPWCRYALTAKAGRGAIETSWRARSPAPAFASTSRWLRGRILDRLRDAAPGDWLAFADPIGEHGADAVAVALAAMAGEGLAQVRAGVPPEARLPIV